MAANFNSSWLITMLLVGVVTTGLVTYIMSSSSTGQRHGPMNYLGHRAKGSLRFVVVISRHGNRGGLKDYPLDPYPLNDTEYWPYGVNELTPYGRKQMFNLGLKVRSLYNGFLSVPYSTREFYASCTGVERVVMSGELVLAGLFKPYGLQIWNEDLLWQPVPIYSNSTDNSPVVGKCPRYLEEREKVYEEFVDSDAANISSLTNYLSNVTGETATASTLYYMFDKLISEDLEGYDIPDWVQEIYPEPLSDFYGKDYITYFAGSDEIVRLVVGPLFGEILSALESKVDDDALTGRRMRYYSAHDSTIVALQALLGIPKSSIIGVVKPGSAMIMELHQETESKLFYIEVLYIDGTSSRLEPRSVSLPTCGNPCYYDNLVNITQRFTGVNYDEECQTSSSNLSAPTEPLYRNYLYT